MNTESDPPIPNAHKRDQSIHIVFRQKLENGLMETSPEDAGIPTICISGTLATLRMRRHLPVPIGTLECLKQTLIMLSGQEMAIANQIEGRDWDHGTFRRKAQDLGRTSSDLNR
jgi:hypothetical protein